MAGMRLFGEISRNFGLNCSPLPMSTGKTCRATRLLEKQGDLVAVGRRPVVQVDHGSHLAAGRPPFYVSQNRDADIFFPGAARISPCARAPSHLDPRQRGSPTSPAPPATPVRAGARRSPAPPCFRRRPALLDAETRQLRDHRVATLHDLGKLEQRSRRCAPDGSRHTVSKAVSGGVGHRRRQSRSPRSAGSGPRSNSAGAGRRAARFRLSKRSTTVGFQ